MKNKNLISISGKMGSGKDTVGAIIQMLVSELHYKTSTWSKKDLITKSDSSIMRFIENHSKYQVRKFADKLKDIVCILLNCTREQLENREFKEKELGEEWNKYAFYRKGTRKPLRIYATYEEAEKDLLIFKDGRIEKIVMTPRKLLQLLGTEAGRDIIHPNIWVNSLMREYKPYSKGKMFSADNFFNGYSHTNCKGCNQRFIGYKRSTYCNTCIKDDTIQDFPKWIITDTRYPNEIDAISKLGGVKIKVINPRIEEDSMHLSEVALDNYEDWDYIIVNDGTLEDLENEVKEVLEDMWYEI